MKNKIKKLIGITLILSVCSSFSVASSINNDYMNKFEENTFYSILGGGGGASDYYQMMTYYEMITLNANQLKQFNNDLEQMRVYLEQVKKLPEDLIIQELAKHSDMVKELLEIQNTTKDVLKSARDFETYYNDVYSDVKNGNYIDLLDKYALNLNNIAYEAMRTSNMSAEASKNAGKNAKYLLEQTKTAQNPTQVLEVLSKWNSNLSYQLNSISEMINNSNRLQILEKQREASEIQLTRQQQEKAKKLLEQRYQELRKKSQKSKGAW